MRRSALGKGGRFLLRAVLRTAASEDGVRVRLLTCMHTDPELHSISDSNSTGPLRND